jgi:hypothetical protein
MADQAAPAEQFFKTAWFSKAAKKAHISDGELCAAIRQVLLGHADDLGGGVFKKRLSKNMYRSIILARGGRYWVYEYLFAKNDRSNIDNTDLDNLRILAKAYGTLTEQQVDQLTQLSDCIEICH